jgi:hypothetical protein
MVTSIKLAQRYAPHSRLHVLVSCHCDGTRAPHSLVQDPKQQPRSLHDFSDEWINDTLINMMFSHLSERAEEDTTLDSFVIIETTRFMHDINKATSERDHTKPLTSFLKHLEDRICNENFDTLVFPAHLDEEKHWLAFKIDFEHRELSYGKLNKLVMWDTCTHSTR